LEILKVRDDFEHLGADENVMLKWIKIGFRLCELDWTVQDKVQWHVLCGHVIELLDSIKSR
jgi:hypothetical protein